MNNNAAQQQPQKSEANQNVQSPDLDSYTDLTVGQILQRTREHYGQTLEQVEANLRIRASQLYALEAGDLSQIPGRVYAIGFVRAYSEYLGLDGDKMVQLFKAQSVGKRAKPQLQYPVTYEESTLPNIYIILGCLAGLVLLIAYWTITYTPTRYVENIPPVPETLKQSTLLKPVLQPPSDKVLVEAMQKPEVKANKMELVVSSDSWVEIKDASGKTVVSQVLKPGDKYIVPEGEEGLMLATGNAGGISVFIDGKKVTALGEKNQVRRNIALKPEDFKSE